MRLVSVRFLLLFLVVGVLGNEPKRSIADDARASAPLEESIVFRATFDKSITADVGAGDKQLHTSKTLARKEARSGLHTKAVKWDESRGRVGGALHFTSKTEELVYFKGGRNLPYVKSDFQGTVSLWLKLSPKEDLPKGFVDPLQITDKKWNDASFFIDFDQSKDRPFRLGVFSDFGFWNPKKTKFDDIPIQERPMVSVKDWPFDRSKWTNVTFTWDGFNSDKPGISTLYLDGKLYGSIKGKQQYTWNPEKAVIMLGINYVGWIDDLVIFDRALSASELQRFLK